MKASDIPQECIQDPRFIKVLGASLCSEIAESKIILAEINAEIEGLKESVHDSWEKRKIYKQSINDLSKKKEVLTTALKSLSKEVQNRSMELAAAKNRLDDATLRELEDRAKFNKILEKYRDTWQIYKGEYEGRPLPMERKRCWMNMKQLEVQYRILQYKKEEFMKMMKQRKEIDEIRIRTSLVVISEMILQRRKDEKNLDNLKTTIVEIGEQLTVYTRQLSEVQQGLERKRLAESDETLKMPPPRLDFPFMRPIINGERWRISSEVKQAGIKSRRDAWASRESDTTSLNTMILNEICDDYDDDVDADIGKERASEKLLDKGANDENHSEFLTTNRKSAESIFPMRNPRSKGTATGSKMIDKSAADIVRHKLQGLGIEKKNVSSFAHQAKQQRAITSNDKLNVISNDENTRTEEKKNYGSANAMESDDSPRQRTRRWCEDSANEKLVSGYAPVVGRRDGLLMRSPSNKSESTNEQHQGRVTGIEVVDGSSNERRHRRSGFNSSVERATDEEKDCARHIRAELAVDGQRETRRPGRAVPTRERSPNNLAMATDNSSVVTSTNQQVAHWTTKHLGEAGYSDEMMLDESSLIGVSRPKIRKIDRINYPSLITHGGHKEPGEPGELTIFDSSSIDEPSSRPNLAYLRQYEPSSCISSENLSISEGPHPQRKIPGQCKIGNPDFPSTSNRITWSPPAEQQSETSFAFSSIIEPNNKNNYTSLNHRDVEPRNQLINKPLGFGGFFKKTEHNQRKLF